RAPYPRRGRRRVRGRARGAAGARAGRARAGRGARLGRPLAQRGRRPERPHRGARRRRGPAHLRARARAPAGARGRRASGAAGAGPGLLGAVEGAEDDAASAARELDKLELGPGDAVVALSASGRTPYALAALEHARRRGARAIAITCAPDSPLAKAAEIAIVAVVGPEVIAGSTRLKGGLAQKMILHTLSTAVMVRLGGVQGNLMTGLRAVNSKLYDRGVRILCELSGVSPADAASALEEAEGSVQRALEKLGVT